MTIGLEGTCTGGETEVGEVGDVGEFGVEGAGDFERIPKKLPIFCLSLDVVPCRWVRTIESEEGSALISLDSLAEVGLPGASILADFFNDSVGDLGSTADSSFGSSLDRFRLSGGRVGDEVSFSEV